MGSATIKVKKKSGETFEYSREAVWAEYYRGFINVDDFSFVRTKSIDELIKKMNKHDIISYSDDFLDIDDFISEMIKKYGEDFEPIENERYENSKGYGTDGFATRLYLEEYKSNKANLQVFIEKLKALKLDDVDKILLIKYDDEDEIYDDEDDEADPEMWILVNRSGKLAEG